MLSRDEEKRVRLSPGNRGKRQGRDRVNPLTGAEGLEKSKKQLSRESPPERDRMGDCRKSTPRRSAHLTQPRSRVGEKHYRCAEHGKSSSESTTLMNRQRIHTRETPYTCSLPPRQPLIPKPPSLGPDLSLPPQLLAAPWWPLSYHLLPSNSPSLCRIRNTVPFPAFPVVLVQPNPGLALS